MKSPTIREPPEAPLETADVETSSADYARRFRGPVGEWFLTVQAETTLDLLHPWPGARVLDLGGGHGQMTGPLVDAGFDVTVYGSSQDCRERVEGWVERGEARFEAGNLLQTPFPDRAFDVVISYRLLPHVSRWPELVHELCRVARLAVLIDYPTRRSVNAVSSLLFGLKKKIEQNTRPFTVFRDSEVVEAFRASAFRVTGRRPQFLFPMALHRGLGTARASRVLEGVGARLRLASAFGSPVILRLEPE